MCVCDYMRLCACMYICLRVYFHIYVLCIYICIFVYVPVYSYVCQCVFFFSSKEYSPPVD